MAQTTWPAMAGHGFGPGSFIGQRACWSWPAMAGHWFWPGQTNGPNHMASHGWPWVWARKFHRATGLLVMARHGGPLVLAWSDQWPKPNGQPWLAMGLGQEVS